MNRAEYRRTNREKRQGQVLYKLTADQIAGLKFKAVEEAADRIFVLMLGLPLMVLRDKFGFGRKRLERVLNEILELFDSYEKEYFSLDDIKQTIYEETGIRISEKELKKYDKVTGR